MSYDRGWYECANFISHIIQERAKNWRSFDNTLTSSIADEYDLLAKYILEIQSEINKQVQPTADIS